MRKTMRYGWKTKSKRKLEKYSITYEKNPIRPIQLQNAVGEMVVCEEKVDVLADYLENVQWNKEFSKFKPTGTNQLFFLFCKIHICLRDLQIFTADFATLSTF